MESALILVSGFFVGYLVGVLNGRRSIVTEAQELVAEALMEIYKHDRQRKSS